MPAPLALRIAPASAPGGAAGTHACQQCGVLRPKLHSPPLFCAQPKVTLRIAPASAPAAPSQHNAAAPPGPKKIRDTKMGVINERRIASIFKEGRGAGVTEEEKVLVLQGRDKAKKLAMTFFKTHNKCGGKLRKDLAEAIQNVLHQKDPSDASKILKTLTNQCRMELKKEPLRKSKNQKGGDRLTVAEFRDRQNTD